MLSLSICALIDTVSSIYGHNNTDTTTTTTTSTSNSNSRVAGIGVETSVVHEVVGYILSLVLEDREVSICVIIYMYVYRAVLYLHCFYTIESAYR